MNVPIPRHGEVCFRTATLVDRFLDTKPTGRVVTNDSGVITARDPDTVRGPDVAYYSFARIPPGPLPRHYRDVVPEVVFEVHSATDRWREILYKLAEYLEAGVTVVVVLDEQTSKAHIHRDDREPETLDANDELTLPDVLPGFAIKVSKFFEPSRLPS